MSVHQLDRSLVRSLVERVAGVALTARTDAGRAEGGSRGASDDGRDEHLLDDVAVSRVFATAAWSAMVEPGDAVAGLLVGALGADRALSMLIEGRSPADWLAAAASQGAGVADELGVAELTAAMERWRPRLSSRIAVGALKSAAQCRARFITPDDAAWPPLLDVLGHHAPLGLWVRGDVRALTHPGGTVAIVGSRDATTYGEHVAMDLASGLSDRGLAVISGAAYGIDGIAHRACLASRGTTIAFLAGGVDRLYPAAHHDLLVRVAASGAIVSELPCGSSPTRWRFLQRNRLIAASAHATVVIEAGRRSGSLNTAGHAAALGRPLGAVPGPVTSVTSEGCHRLLRDYDAVCVTSPGDVVEMIFGAPDARPVVARSDPSAPASSAEPRVSAQQASDGSAVNGGPPRRAAADQGPAPADRSRPPGGDPRGATANPDATRVRDALSRRSPRGVPDLARRTGMAPRAVAVTLGVLALEGGAYENENGWLRL